MNHADPSPRPALTRLDENAVRVPHWMMAALLMLGLHLLWLIWLVPSPALYRASPRIPLRITFLTGAVDGMAAGGDMNGDARVLWSPILLSLPTSMGFSGAVVSEDLDVQPALDAPSGTARFLERGDYGGAPPDAGRHARDLDLAGSTLRDPAPRSIESPVAEPGLVVRLLDGSPSPRPIYSPWPEGEGTVGSDVSWQITARLVFDPDGTAKAAIIEVPAEEADVNRLAARVLRQWQAEPSKSGGIARVVLRHTVAANPASPGEDGAP